MLVSFDWLREFVPYEGSVQELGDTLTMLGLEMDGLNDPFAEIADVVVGHVVECEPHPEADKLSVCTVDVAGPEALTIVCGAPNVAKGQKVPVALVGSCLPEGLKIKKAKLRGVPSAGMICSERELGMSEDHTGILVLDDSCRVGDKLVDALSLERTVMEFDLTPNRADCLSILGFARETAMAFKLPLSLPRFELKESGGKAADHVRIEIDDPDLCSLYQGRVLLGGEVRPSPAWMRYRLLAMGQRPISNFVDVTNYVMLELGHPQHAFDLDLVEGGVIRVARATDGMEFVTLDGQTRKLTRDDQLIWDGKRPVGLAGVMGGANSEVHDGTKNIMLECAVFRAATVRKTARRLALPSEASHRFERGVDQGLARFCIDRGAQLMAETSGAQVLSGVCAAEPRPWQPRFHRFRLDRSNSLLGLDLTHEFCKTTFEGLGCTVDDSNPADWKVESPSHRLDLEREVDLVEEAGRVYGLDRIPAVLPRVARTFDSPTWSDTEYGFLRRIKDWGRGVGLREAVNYSFVGTQDLDRLNLDQESRVAVANPLSEDQNVMRPQLAPGLMHTLRHNMAQGNTRLRIFEVAKGFTADEESETTARERTHLGLLLTGNRTAEDWPWPAQDADYLDVKGLVEHLLDSLKLPEAGFKAVKDHSFLEPCVGLTLGDSDLGVMGRVRPDIADDYHARKPVWLAELDLDLLRSLVGERQVTFAPLPTFPPVRRDVTFFCPAGLAAGRILDTIRENAPAILESVALVAEFVPENSQDQRNLSFRMTYRHAKKTLKDKEVDKQHAGLVESVKAALGVSV